ncbi:molybdopterin-binding protein [Sneathiella marina]|uniref:Molybdopterin-binding protein n=1 Tax=Sneathiella marina TaxID=2950108 RepID=A0ABY4W2G4_9PROT|nr:molybdopterin-binding protein [Sneathiella marina]USG59509.1 molybdopterin-binding protein [Sneathiella marina]
MSVSEQKPSDLKIVTAAVIVIGDEILSGRTKDKNMVYLAEQLIEQGVQLREVRVIPDIENEIINAVNSLRKKFDYVFTTGGIGPTHDDITADSIAAAFNIEIGYHPEAMNILTRHYENSGIEFNEARMRMARIPEGALLIDNPVSKAPGFQVENVFVMAGVPIIMQAMFEGIISRISGGARMLSRTIGAGLPEGKIAGELGALQNEFPDVSMGSYPFFRQGEVGTNLVLRSINQLDLDRAFEKLKKILQDMKVEIVETT